MDAELLKNKTLEAVKKNELFEVSGQAVAIISAISDFPTDHFIEWWITHRMAISGGDLHQYLCSEDGFAGANKPKGTVYQEEKVI